MNTVLPKLILFVVFLAATPVLHAQNATGARQAVFCEIDVEVPLCPNKTFILDGNIYGAPWVVKDTLFSNSGDCDTIVTYHLTLLPFNKANKTVLFCPGESVTIDGIVFDEKGTYISNVPFPSTNGGCDTLFTYMLDYQFQPVFSDSIVLKPGETVVIGGVTYSAPAFVSITIPATVGCDTLVNYSIVLDPTFPDTCSKTLTFLKTIGLAGPAERGSVICPAADGNLYIGGEREKQSLLIKVSDEGDVLWTRAFQPVAGFVTRITDLIEDSDGMLVGCGIVNPDSSSPEAYAFRFNPTTGNMMWSRYLKQAKPEALAIIESAPGGPFWMLVTPQLVSNVDDAEIWKLSRSNGTLAGAIDHYTFGTSDVWNSLVVHSGAVYATGRHIPGGVAIPAPLNKTLTGLTKIDPATGLASWTRLGHIAPSAQTTLYGTDLLIHDNAILSVSTGFDSLAFNLRSAFFLQKTSLDGQLLWLKRYSVPGLQQVAAHDIQRISDGYLLSGQADMGNGNVDKIVVKTDFDGNVLWAKSLVSGFYDSNPGQYFIHNHQTVVRQGMVYLVAFTEYAKSDILLLKMTTDGHVSDSCGFVHPLDVQAKTIVAPVITPVQVDQAPYVVSSVNAPVMPATLNLNSLALCLRCCEPVPVALALEFCPGESVVVGGVTYTQPGMVTDTLPGTTGCDTIVTYTLTLLPQPVRTETIEFCAGDTVFVAGLPYSQPVTFNDTIPATSGCDTVATYILQWLDPTGQVLSVDCPDDVNVAIGAGTAPVAVFYDLPAVQSDCDCPGIALQMTQGLPPGALFSAGNTNVCYTATDSCGNSATCCFKVFVREESPCDSKTVGCLKWELLDIEKNADGELRYRIRVTNNCPAPLIYAAMEIPDGATAVLPLNNSTYLSPDGRSYEVRNPNFSPFYSIRFKSLNDSIAGGESDVFEYLLPGQTPPAYIHVTARLAPQTFHEAYLNTFNCPVGTAPGNRPAVSRTGNDIPAGNLRVFPNPTSGVLYADLSAWPGERLRLRIFDSRGQLVREQEFAGGPDAQAVVLPEGLSAGLYFLEIRRENGTREATRFEVLRRY